MYDVPSAEILRLRTRGIGKLPASSGSASGEIHVESYSVHTMCKTYVPPKRGGNGVNENRA